MAVVHLTGPLLLLCRGIVNLPSNCKNGRSGLVISAIQRARCSWMTASFSMRGWRIRARLCCYRSRLIHSGRPLVSERGLLGHKAHLCRSTGQTPL